MVTRFMYCFVGPPQAVLCAKRVADATIILPEGKEYIIAGKDGITPVTGPGFGGGKMVAGCGDRDIWVGRAGIYDESLSVGKNQCTGAF